MSTRFIITLDNQCQIIIFMTYGRTVAIFLSTTNTYNIFFALPTFHIVLFLFLISFFEVLILLTDIIYYVL